VSRWVRRQCGTWVRDRPACLERTLAALVGQTGIRHAMEVLDTLALVDADVRFNAHALAHGDGIAANRTPENLAATFAACPPTQLSGCYHGVLQGYFLALAREGREPGTAELDGMCEPHRATSFLLFQCAHGMGHGLMAFHGNHLPASLASCDLASDGQVREWCYGGAFMENVMQVANPHHTAGGHAETQGAHAGHGGDAAGGAAHVAHGQWRALDRDDPQYPCDAVARKYQEACYTMQTSPILLFNEGDIEATTRACEAAPAVFVPTCFSSLGRDLTAWADRDPLRLVGMCERTGEAAAGRALQWCISGAAMTLMNQSADPGDGVVFCRVVRGAEPRAACYEAVGSFALWLGAGVDERARYCAGPEPELVAACRRAAELPQAGAGG
jgi:hypothetical protein